MSLKAVGLINVAVIAALLLPAPSFAQAKTDSSRTILKTRSDSSRARFIERMNSRHFSADSLKRRLSLSPEQETKVRELVQAYQEQTMADRELYKGVAMAQLRASKERFDKFDKEMLAVLDANQKKKYEAFKRELGNRNKETPRKKTSPKTNTENTP